MRTVPTVLEPGMFVARLGGVEITDRAAYLTGLRSTGVKVPASVRADVAPRRVPAQRKSVVKVLGESAPTQKDWAPKELEAGTWVTWKPNGYSPAIVGQVWSGANRGTVWVVPADDTMRPERGAFEVPINILSPAGDARDPMPMLDIVDGVLTNVAESAPATDAEILAAIDVSLATGEPVPLEDAIAAADVPVIAVTEDYRRVTHCLDYVDSRDEHAMTACGTILAVTGDGPAARRGAAMGTTHGADETGERVCPECVNTAHGQALAEDAGRVVTAVETSAAPTCPRHGEMVERPAARMSREQAECGTWYDCTATPRCGRSVLIPSDALRAQLGELGVAAEASAPTAAQLAELAPPAAGTAVEGIPAPVQVLTDDALATELATVDRAYEDGKRTAGAARPSREQLAAWRAHRIELGDELYRRQHAAPVQEVISAQPPVATLDARRQALFARAGDEVLFGALFTLEGKHDGGTPLTDEEKLTRAWILGEIERRHPQVDPVMDAWVDTDDDPRNYTRTLMAAVAASTPGPVKEAISAAPAAPKRDLVAEMSVRRAELAEQVARRKALAARYPGRVHLQSIGRVPAIPTGDLRPGDVLMYNGGSTAVVVSVTPKGKASVVLVVDSVHQGKTTRSERFSRSATLQAIADRPDDDD